MAAGHDSKHSWFTTSQGQGSTDGALPGAKDLCTRPLPWVGTWKKEEGLRAANVEDIYVTLLLEHLFSFSRISAG